MNTGEPWPDVTDGVGAGTGDADEAAPMGGRPILTAGSMIVHNLVYDPAFLVAAWSRVRGNKGARTAGVDRIAPRDVIGDGVADCWTRSEESQGRRFVPERVREKAIPKASGKIRRLGIPTTADRIVQAALKLVLEPIFEADFKPCSYGFRPRRRAQDAIAEIHYLGSPTRNYEWVFEADIAACFDEIDHSALMGRVRDASETSACWAG